VSDITVAVVSDGALRAYHRNGSDLAQVAQFAVAAEVDPSAIAAAIADLGDLFGWHGTGGVGQPAGAVGRAVGALPAAPVAKPPVAHPVAAQPPRRKPAKRRSAEQVVAQREQILAVIRGHPGIMRADVARITGLNLPTVKRYTDAMVAQGIIDAAPMPGVRERGPGGGHGLFARAQAQVS
jgi:hypothetical protein